MTLRDEGRFEGGSEEGEGEGVVGTSLIGVALSREGNRDRPYSSERLA